MVRAHILLMLLLLASCGESDRHRVIREHAEALDGIHGGARLLGHRYYEGDLYLTIEAANRADLDTIVAPVRERARNEGCKTVLVFIDSRAGIWLKADIWVMCKP